MSSMELSGDEGKKRRRSIRDKATYWFTLVFTIASLITFFVFSHYTIIEADIVLKEDLTQALAGAAEGVDVSVLLALAENGEKNSAGFSNDARYLALMDWLDQVHRIDPDVWPYLYIESDEARHIYFVVDLVSIYDPDNSAEFMELYESQSGYILDGLEEATFRAVKGPVAEFLETLSDDAGENGHESLQSFLFNFSEFLDQSYLSLGRDFGTYTDKYGRWASGYIPLDTPAGEPRAALGMDYKAEMVDNLHDAVLKRLVVSMVVLYGVGLIIIIFFTNILTQPIVALQQKARAYGDQGSPAVFIHKKYKRYSDEIDDLEDILAQMVEKIRLRDRRYEAVVATQSELIVRWKPDGTVNFTNPVFNEYFPTLAEYNLYSNEYHYFIPGEEKKFIELYKNILPKLTQEDPFVFLEVFVNNAKGEKRCIQYHIRALFSPGGDLEEYQAVGRDITELKRVNAQLDEVNKELHNLNHRLLNEREHDRTELARELHDDILNYISELFMTVSDIPSDSAQAIYHKLVEKVRSTIYDLRPPMLSYGLYLGLEDFVDGISERFGSDTKINFLLPSSVTRFDPNVEIQLFRIVQEACSNALMHANANELTIDGKITEEKVFISVEDNGLGFEYEVDVNSGAFITNMKYGLIGMQERAGLIGADVQVISEPGKGTKIRLTWAPTSETGASSAA